MNEEIPHFQMRQKEARKLKKDLGDVTMSEQQVTRSTSEKKSKDNKPNCLKIDTPTKHFNEKDSASSAPLVTLLPQQSSEESHSGQKTLFSNPSRGLRKKNDATVIDTKLCPPTISPSVQHAITLLFIADSLDFNKSPRIAIQNRGEKMKMKFYWLKLLISSIRTHLMQ